MHKKLIRLLVLSLENLINTFKRLNIHHGNLKLSNCFLKLSSSGKLMVVVSDPHIQMMFSEPQSDNVAIANMIH